ncbi:hypothetical protein I6N90_13465 [Paenibacillus sp. GSMTC-2017]|uniref:hypothetical protein n=1 Tax=Paenibacillus sp. GSMTC-2017 TaxID=2794350 RepID=UPI0018D70619|nr:hypothetical protein [Paenibacillus sp. GSMTC-2017]MBH5318810.1 hypothetical protein [Paenibacillus sp. GSMTC-2017]
MNLNKRFTPILTMMMCVGLTVGCGSTNDKTIESTDDLAILSDEFDDASTLNQWLIADDVSHSKKEEGFFEVMDINTTRPGSLYILPTAGTWYSINTGHLSYKKIKGDFSITLRVKVLGKSSSIPSGAYDLAGLMARTPSQIEGEIVPANGENWEYITTGGEGNKRIVDYKTTVNSQSSYLIKEVASEWIILRMVRVGSTFVKLYKEDDQGEWQLASTMERDHLPEELQVGINFLTNLNGAPDHTIEADYIRYSRPLISKELQEKITQKTVTDDDWKAAFSN